VDTTESGGDAGLNVHPILRRHDKDMEAALEHTNDTFNDVTELGMAEVVAFLDVCRPSRL